LARLPQHGMMADPRPSDPGGAQQSPRERAMPPSVSSPAACQICGMTRARATLVPAALVRPAVAARIRASFPGWSEEGLICQPDLNRFRAEHVQALLREDRGELSSLEQAVVASLARDEPLASDTDAEFEQTLTFGQRLADRIADFGGSWTFLSSFAGFILLWMFINSVLLVVRPFDPYPFILLNLCLSCLAAVQAPIIMMSQNRQEARDRLQAQNDYRVNLKAEMEIRHLHEKLDHLIEHQWERLLEIQEIQVELMNDLAARHRREP
jgi:uncharacterized membrane protein